MVIRFAPIAKLASATAAAFLLASVATAQSLAFERLPAEQLAVTAPSARVTGEPGSMRIAAGECRTTDEADLRGRILAVAVQEWGYFGFNVVDETALVEDDDEGRERRRGPRRRFSWIDPVESARVAASIAGYWAVTRDGGWILERQNADWQGPDGVGARWRDPWSAAFISWVMCESGLGSEDRFRRHIAHHAYIDQAIQARDAPDSAAAFVAHDVGELALEPGDMVCRARRGAYRSIDERRRDLGVGVRSHCDIVVKVEPEHHRLLAIGGNVQGRVSLKLLPATFYDRGGESVASSIGRGRRVIFAHLKLRAPSIEAEAFHDTPTLVALSERTDVLLAVERRVAGDAAPAGSALEASLPSRSVLASP